MAELIETWRSAALADETPRLTALAVAALNAPHSAEALRDLAVGAALAQGLDAAKAAALIRWGLGEKASKLHWDAVHAAGELALPDLASDLRKVIDSPKRYAETVRGRAAEAYAETARMEASELLEKLRVEDDAWTVRRLATDALRMLRSDKSERGHLFSRLQALIRCGLIRFESDDDPLEPKELGKLGLRVPEVYLAFLCDVFPGGRMVFVDRSKDTEEDGETFFLHPPRKLGEAVGTTPADIKNANEYVWARYVESSKNYSKLDEDYALKRYAEFYGRRGRVDADSYNYGVLLFEAAFRDEANRATHLLRCRDILRAYGRVAGGEEWDVVDDRLAEAEDLIAEESLSWGDGVCERPITLGQWMGVTQLLIDPEVPGVFAHDDDEDPPRWQVTRSLAAFLNGPSITKPDAEAPPDPLEQLAEVEGCIDAGRKREAARLYCEVLEANPEAEPVLERAAAVLLRDDMEPLSAAQLLATIPLEGDRKSMDVVRAVLLALTTEQATALVEAAAPYNEAGSQIAHFIDAAAGIRRRSHAAVKNVAKQLRDSRAKAHIRTLKNPWYKK